MSNPFFDHPILNSPYSCPTQHWELDKDGQPTQQTISARRRAEFITPIPKPKKRKNAEAQQEIVFNEVLAIGNGAELKVGTPLVSGASVTVTVLSHGKHDKVRIFKMRRRKHYQKRQGHRQQFTELQIGAIVA